jgi:hypothetical protein
MSADNRAVNSLAVTLAQPGVGRGAGDLTGLACLTAPGLGPEPGPV